MTVLTAERHANERRRRLFLNILIYYFKDVGRKVLREVGKREARDRNRQLMSVTRAILQALTYSYYFCPNVSP